MKESGPRLLADLFAGSSLGLLLGVMVGMSATPVVANLIGAVTAAAIAFLGLRSELKSNQDAGESREKGSSMGSRVRIGGFAIFCLVGILTGVFVRTHDLLSRPLTDRVAAWKSAGFSDPEARAIVVFQDTKLNSSGWKVEKDSGAAPTNASILYSSLSGLCSEADPGKFPNPPATLQAWTAFGGSWEKLSAVVRGNVPAEKQQIVLRELYQTLCTDQEKK